MLLLELLKVCPGNDHLCLYRLQTGDLHQILRRHTTDIVLKSNLTDTVFCINGNKILRSPLQRIRLLHIPGPQCHDHIRQNKNNRQNSYQFLKLLPHRNQPPGLLIFHKYTFSIL